MDAAHDLEALAKRWGYNLRNLEPGASYPYDAIRGFYRVPMFQAGLLECVDADAKPICFKLTDFGASLRALSQGVNDGL